MSVRFVHEVEDSQQQVETMVTVWVILTHTLFWDAVIQISDLAVGIRCCSTLRRGVLRLMDFRSAGERDRMSTNLKLLAAIDLGVLAMAFVGKGREHPFCGNVSQYCSSGN